MELNKIYNEDCIDGMKRIPDKSIDAIICDLPYGTTRNKWDCIIPLDKLWEQYKRIIKDKGAIVLFAQCPFDKVLGASNLKMLRYEWIWQKDTGTGFLNANLMPLKDHENILVFYKNLPTYNPQMKEGKPYYRKRLSASSNYGKVQDVTITDNKGFRYPTTIINFPRDTDKLHPTQKPLALISYLIQTYTNEGDLVLDNCMGSGTTAVACTELKRNFIGFELDKGYYDIAIKRLDKARAELTLF